ncbi:SMODS domain-containing nucleotidyltransferase [Blastococcus sp. PRF04-17]|uniref:SMODS domain-containing nucleotidyltransferase n=1 Tax=Blastococcus sp. PRF04-17 TaxID=2933797 RepID=UPI001FF467DF|nr:hypothetical protein [Blastococcus sp. PRF04-17]UOY01635.1 hypothetical protein MVA48_22395 [Blastococcus sp. PRF04-17]
MGDPTLAAYAQSLAPPPYDRATASRRRAPIEGALGRSTLRVTRMFESGSWSHGTAIKAKSDVDYMAAATGTRPTYPSSALATARTAISLCDPSIATARVSSPVVQVAYYTPPNFEIAPAWFKGRSPGGYDVYWIGGRGDEWVQSAPAAHLAYVDRQNDRLGKKVKPLVRLLKAWKHHAGAPVSSFYLEMRTAEHAAGEASIVYEIDLISVIRTIVEMGARDMNDPQHIVGRIPACSSDEKRRQTVRLLENAWRSLFTASQARARGDRAAYWHAMCAVFGSDYPWPTW